MAGLNIQCAIACQLITALRIAVWQSEAILLSMMLAGLHALFRFVAYRHPRVRKCLEPWCIVRASADFASEYRLGLAAHCTPVAP